MDNLPKWAVKAITVWGTIGLLLATIGISGLPDWVPVLFSEEITNSIVTVLGELIVFYQILRGIFIAKPEKEGEVKILSIGDKRKYQFNPFKLAA